MFLGVDGGGSKTAFMLIERTGAVVASATTGSTYHPEVGVDGVRAALGAGVDELLGRAGTPASAVEFAFYGLPAFGEDPRVDPVLAQMPAAVFPAGRYLVGNDMVCSWSGSLAGADGISVIAGTGSMAYGEFAGRSARAGGWGEVFGDEGSAYWIAREGLALFARMSDGRSPAGPLLERVRRHFALPNDLDIAGHINGLSSTERSSIARLATVVAAAAADGDTLAAGIFRRAAAELVDAVVAVRDRLGVPADIALPVSYTGGVFSPGGLVHAPFAAAIDASGRRLLLQAPRLSPVKGAALYAARRAGVVLGPADLDRLASG